jgi:hypothetical protein
MQRQRRPRAVRVRRRDKPERPCRRWCDCSCDVHPCSLLSAPANLTHDQYASSSLQVPTPKPLTCAFVNCGEAGEQCVSNVGGVSALVTFICVIFFCCSLGSASALVRRSFVFSAALCARKSDDHQYATLHTTDRRLSRLLQAGGQ